MHDREQTRTRPRALDGLLTIGTGIRKSLDALVNNFFKGNATVIGEGRQPRRARRKPQGEAGRVWSRHWRHSSETVVGCEDSNGI